MFNIKIIENVRKNLFFLFLLDETIVPHSLSQYKVLIKLLPIGYTYESFMQASSEQGQGGPSKKQQNALAVGCCMPTTNAITFMKMLKYLSFTTSQPVGYIFPRCVKNMSIMHSVSSPQQKVQLWTTMKFLTRYNNTAKSV